MFAVINSINEEHANHTLDDTNGSLAIVRSECALKHEGEKRAFRSFFTISNGGRGAIMKAQRHIFDLFPHISIPESVVRNAMAKNAYG